jgi:hypothetical protein
MDSVKGVRLGSFGAVKPLLRRRGFGPQIAGGSEGDGGPRPFMAGAIAGIVVEFN